VNTVTPCLTPEASQNTELDSLQSWPNRVSSGSLNAEN